MRAWIRSVAAAPFVLGHRMGRAQFIVAIAVQAVMAVVPVWILIVAAQDVPSLRWLYGMIPAAAAAQGAIAILTFHTLLARLHDLDLSGWWMIPMAIPALIGGLGTAIHSGLDANIARSIGLIPSIVFMTMLFTTPGTAGENLYGEQPGRYGPQRGGMPATDAGSTA